MPEIGDVTHGFHARPGRGLAGPTGLIEVVRTHVEYMPPIPPHSDGPAWVARGDQEKVLARLSITEAITLIDNLARSLADMPGAKH